MSMISKIVPLVLVAVFLTSLPIRGMAEQTVFVSILPQKFFVEQIAGGRFTVEVMVQPGASPHTYEPKPSQMRKLASSLAYFSIGVSFESVWLEKIAGINKDMAVIPTDVGIEKLAMAEHHGGPEAVMPAQANGTDPHVNEAGGLDPHIWLAPSLVKIQAETIKQGLCRIDAAHAQQYQSNYETFIGRIDLLDKRLRVLLQGKQGRQFMVFHPSWGYFAREYGLEQVPIEIEGKSPKPAQLKGLIEHARELEIRVVFAQPQLSRKSAEVIAREINGEVILVDPLEENWLANLENVGLRLGEVLK